MSNKSTKGGDAALPRRMTKLENEVARLRSEILKLTGIIQLIAPTVNVSMSKSMKTSVIQIIQWGMRRGQVSEQEAVQNAIARLEQRGFTKEDITPEMQKYIREQAARIYSESTGKGWVPPTEPESEEGTPTVKTAGDNT
jgi:hypothetical protein